MFHIALQVFLWFKVFHVLFKKPVMLSLNTYSINYMIKKKSVIKSGLIFTAFIWTTHIYLLFIIPDTWFCISTKYYSTSYYFQKNPCWISKWRDDHVKDILEGIRNWFQWLILLFKYFCGLENFIFYSKNNIFVEWECSTSRASSPTFHQQHRIDAYILQKYPFWKSSMVTLAPNKNLQPFSICFIVYVFIYPHFRWVC